MCSFCLSDLSKFFFSSIKLRASILQRGLSDRSPAVVKECVKLLIDEWLCKSCNSNPVELLKYLDVETYESVGVSVMRALLGAGMGKPEETQKIQQYKDSCDEAEGLIINNHLFLIFTSYMYVFSCHIFVFKSFDLHFTNFLLNLFASEEEI